MHDGSFPPGFAQLPRRAWGAWPGVAPPHLERGRRVALRGLRWHKGDPWRRRAELSAVSPKPPQSHQYRRVTNVPKATRYPQSQRCP